MQNCICSEDVTYLDLSLLRIGKPLLLFLVLPSMMVKAGDVGSCTMEPPALMLAPFCTTWGPLVVPGIVLVLSSKGWPLTAVMVVEGPSGATEGGLVDMKSVT